MFYKYKVKWSFEDNIVVDQGIGKADNFTEAMSQVAQAFGDQEIWSATIHWLNDEDIISLSDLYSGLMREEEESTELGDQLIEVLQDAIEEMQEVNG